MSGHGDDAVNCSNGLSAQKFHAATPEERVIYRTWIFGMVAFYTTFLPISGVAIAIGYSSNSTKLTAASAQRIAVPHRTN